MVEVTEAEKCSPTDLMLSLCIPGCNGTETLDDSGVACYIKIGGRSLPIEELPVCTKLAGRCTLFKCD